MSFKFFYPACRSINCFKIKAVCSNNIFNRNFAASCFNNFNFWLNFINYSTNHFHLFICNKVPLVYDKSRTEFNLLNKERFNIFFINAFFKQRFSFVKFINKAGCINNANNVIKFTNFNCFNSLSNWHWFTNTRSFN